MEEGRYIISASIESQMVAIDQPGRDLEEKPNVYPLASVPPQNQTWMVTKCPEEHSDSSGGWRILSDLDNDFGLTRDAESK